MKKSLCKFIFLAWGLLFPFLAAAAAGNFWDLSRFSTTHRYLLADDIYAAGVKAERGGDLATAVNCFGLAARLKDDDRELRKRHEEALALLQELAAQRYAAAVFALQGARPELAARLARQDLALMGGLLPTLADKVAKVLAAAEEQLTDE